MTELTRPYKADTPDRTDRANRTELTITTTTARKYSKRSYSIQVDEQQEIRFRGLVFSFWLDWPDRTRQTGQDRPGSSNTTVPTQQKIISTQAYDNDEWLNFIEPKRTRTRRADNQGQPKLRPEEKDNENQPSKLRARDLI